MDWAQSSYVGTIFAAVLVAISAVIALRQLLVQTSLARAGNAQALVGLTSPFNLELIKSPELAMLMVSALCQDTCVGISYRLYSIVFAGLTPCACLFISP